MRAYEFQPTMIDWESMWAPYDEATYQAVLEQICTHDIVLDIGAGDLRLAQRMANLCKRVYAIEIQERIINRASHGYGHRLPANLIVLHADARYIPFPEGVTTAVLLMRHCTHFRLYAEKLKAQGAKRLITNARWRLGIEIVPLQANRMAYDELEIGWYACWCGAVGFKPGPVNLLIPELESQNHEVVNCPQCDPRSRY